MNAVIMISVNRDKYLQYSKPCVESYCNKHGLALEIVDKPKYNLGSKNGYNYGTFEKYQVNKFTEKYERILRLDSDIIVTPHAPNIFDSVPSNNIGVVFEDEGSRRKRRIQEILRIQKVLGDLKWQSGYFNSGVVVTSKIHKDIYRFDDSDIKTIETKNLGPFKEQSYLNWNVRNKRYPISNLGYKFNHLSLFSELGFDRKNSFFIHYAGNQKNKEKKMKEDYYRFYERK